MPRRPASIRGRKRWGRKETYACNLRDHYGRERPSGTHRPRGGPVFSGPRGDAMFTSASRTSASPRASPRASRPGSPPRACRGGIVDLPYAFSRAARSASCCPGGAGGAGLAFLSSSPQPASERTSPKTPRPSHFLFAWRALAMIINGSLGSWRRSGATRSDIGRSRGCDGRTTFAGEDVPTGKRIGRLAREQSHAPAPRRHRKARIDRLFPERRRVPEDPTISALIGLTTTLGRKFPTPPRPNSNTNRRSRWPAGVRVELGRIERWRYRQRTIY